MYYVHLLIPLYASVTNISYLLLQLICMTTIVIWGEKLVSWKNLFPNLLFIILIKYVWTKDLFSDTVVSNRAFRFWLFIVWINTNLLYSKKIDNGNAWFKRSDPMINNRYFLCLYYIFAVRWVNVVESDVEPFLYNL